MCFGLFLLFTRQPDLFDGEKVPAVISFRYDSAAAKQIPKAVYHTGYQVYEVDASYLFKNWEEGEKLTVIFETGTPEKGAVYSLWGYGIGWGEFLGTMLIYVALFQIAISVTKDPSKEALDEQLNYQAIPKKKYQES